ncbi:type VI secretion system tip protein VgrG [Enterobacter bugandensis]|uniref:DUF2345 domain-containing protein n=1 Tax=Enterobacter bugandensis TaxID=881260 RepID=UPI002FCE7957
MEGPSGIVQQQDTLNRYLLYFTRGKSVLPDVHSFTGEEELSKPYRYTIRFTSPTSNIAVNKVLNQSAEFILCAPNPKAGWYDQEPWLPVRQINGVITSFSRLKSSADEALYECVLEHELALLDRNYRSAVYMDVTVPELVTQLMKESSLFEGYNIDFDQLSRSYPRREMVIQWKETDLQFIRRLLAEVGIWFRFENHDKVQGETVVIFGDGGRRYVFSDKPLPYVRHSGMTSHEEYITELEEQYELIPESVLVRTYNYRNPFSPQADKTIFDNDIPDGITSGKQYHYADHYLENGDFYGEEAETATFYARLRYERLLNKQSVLGGTTSDPALLPGVMFHPTGDIPDGFKHSFLVTTMTLSGSRAQHYRAILKGITTEAQPRAAGKQLDMTAAIAQLEKALSLAMTLQQSALTAGASNVETDQQNQLNQVLSNLAGPGLLTYADKGQAHVTPDSLQLSAGKDVIVTAGQDTSLNVVKKFSLAVGEKLSLFSRKLGIQMIARAGDITTQAQRGAMHMLSQNDFTMASTAGQLNGSARQGIQLVCGGGGIRISPNGLVTIFSPTGIELKGPSLKYDGPESAQVTVPPFNPGAFKLRYQLHAGDDPEQILANKKFRLTSSAGKVVEGITDSNGHSSLLDADDLDTYKMELME